MKKLTKILLLVVVLVMSLVLATACETLENHEHKPAAEWLSDGTNHYHACTFEGCTEKLDVTACAGGKATCQEKATCSTCGAQYGELAEHKFNLGYATEEFLATPATHKDKAYYYMSCACGLKGTETFQAGETVPHNYEEVVTAPTCTEAGYTTYTCECGDSYVDDEVPATGHKFIDGKCSCGKEYVVQNPWVLTTELKTGDQVLIAAAAYNKLLSAEKVSAGSYYNKGVDYSASDFSKVTDSEIFVVTVNEDGTYTFVSLTGKTIALADSYSSLNDTGANKSWALIAREDGTFLMKNTGRNLYLEWYSSKSNWSTYSAGNTKEYYLSFYVKNPDYSDVHVHNHISAVTAPTCTEAGYTTYTCDCGDKYTGAEVDATGHTYVNGICACGAKDPNYVDYYLIGYINGADYGNGSDWENLGEYKFVNGTLVATFTADSYVGIKSANLDGEIIGWFWSQNYETSNVGTFEHGKNYGEKMLVTGNVKVTFTLVVNEDGSLTLSVEYHKHNYTSKVTAPTCTTAGYTTYTCECGDSYTGDEVEKLGHVDANLDLKCDREGCTSSVTPKADSTLSLATANLLGSKLSTSNQYYVEGTISRLYKEGDIKNGIFWITDGTGEEFLIRMIKNADGVSHSSWEIKLLVGDKIRVYGKISKLTTQEVSTGYYPQIQGGTLVELISQHPHDFTYSPATCFDVAYCLCGQPHGEPLGHADENTDKICDRCGLATNVVREVIATPLKEKGVVDTAAGTVLFEGVNFNITLAKGGATSTDTGSSGYFQIRKKNTVTIAAKDGQKIVQLVLTTTSSSYVDELEAYLTAAGCTYTIDGLTAIVTVDNLDVVTLNNASTKTARLSSIQVFYVVANSDLVVDNADDVVATWVDHKYSTDWVDSNCTATVAAGASHDGSNATSLNMWHHDNPYRFTTAINCQEANVLVVDFKGDGIFNVTVRLANTSTGVYADYKLPVKLVAGWNHYELSLADSAWTFSGVTSADIKQFDVLQFIFKTDSADRTYKNTSVLMDNLALKNVEAPTTGITPLESTVTGPLLKLDFEDGAGKDKYTNASWAQDKYTSDWVAMTEQINSREKDGSKIINFSCYQGTTYRFTYTIGQTLASVNYVSIDLGNYYSPNKDIKYKVVLVDASGNSHYASGNSDWITFAANSGLETVTFNLSTPATNIVAIRIVTQGTSGNQYLYCDNIVLDYVD